MKENILQFKQIPAFQDNYIWMLSFGGYAWVVDPGDASPVISVLETEKLKLAGILVTHHHNDHVGGVGQLLSWAKSGEVIQVVGPLKESISHVNQSVIEGDRVELFAGVQAQVLEVPGHTKGHIAFYLEKSPLYPSPILFCGDTLFASGCGRLFEGTPAQMSASLDKFAQLPTDALVCCAHEYTHSNIRFSLAVEADNREVSDWAQKVLSLRAENKPTVPTTIGHELLVNPFLRCSQESVMKSASEFAHKDLKDPVDVFAALRSWKDIFK